MRPKQLGVFGDFSHCPDGGPGGFYGVPLFNGDGGRDAYDAVSLRFIHAVQELPGVGGEGLNISALTLGKEGLKGQGTLARSA